MYCMVAGMADHEVHAVRVDVVCAVVGSRQIHWLRVGAADATPRR